MEGITLAKIGEIPFVFEIFQMTNEQNTSIWRKKKHLDLLGLQLGVPHLLLQTESIKVHGKSIDTEMLTLISGKTWVYSDRDSQGWRNE